MKATGRLEQSYPLTKQQSVGSSYAIQRQLLQVQRQASQTHEIMANGWSIIIGLVVIVLACLAAWFFAPKGETQTIWRSSLILSFASCYLMWAITFLAQWHPLIEPRRGGLRDFAAHE